MKTRTVEFTVGLFLIAGVISLLALALQVSGLANMLEEDNGYKIKAEFTNLGGLKVKAKVSLAGVVVGRVVQIALEPDSFYATATLSIDPKRVQNLPEDTRASILTAGLLGDNYISLTPGFNNKAFLQADSVIPAENTDSAMVLEQLISQFVAGQANKSAEALDGPKPTIDSTIKHKEDK